jgi:thiamine pyrophosphate-dependent acetolactate synthase large subunit-like protein
MFGKTPPEAAGPGGIYVFGFGQHEMWAAHYFDYEMLRTWLDFWGTGRDGLGGSGGTQSKPRSIGL